MYTRKTYAYTRDGKQVVFNGHIRQATAIKRGFVSVTLAVHDRSGKGRGQEKRFYGPSFDGLAAYY